MQTQRVDMCSVLRDISSDKGLNADSRSGAARLLKSIDFSCLCLLQMWNRVLQLIDRVNRSLQTKRISVLTAAQMLSGVVESVQELRNAGTTELFQKQSLLLLYSYICMMWHHS